MKRTATLVFIPLLVFLVGTTPALATVDSFFDVYTEIPLFAPPYPTPPVITIIGNNFGAGMTQTHEVRTGLTSFDGGGLFNWASHMQGHDSGGGGGGYGIESFFDVFFEVTIDRPTPPPDSFFDVFLDVYSTAPGHPPGTLMVRHPELPPENPGRYFDVSFVDSFFDVFCTIETESGLEELQFHGTCQSPAEKFANVTIGVRGGGGGGGAVDSFFDIFIEIEIPTLPDLGLPLFTIITKGRFTAGPVAVEPTTWSGIKALYAR